MAQSLGGLAGPMLWLVPRNPEKPGTIMVLGSILTDPYDLESSLNRPDGILPVPEKNVRDQSTAVKRQVKAGLSNQSSLLLGVVQRLVNAGASIEGHLTKNVDTTVNAFNVRATVFEPMDEYIRAALDHKAVKEYARKGLFAKPIYIVVGVATASKLSVKETRSESGGGSAKGGVVEPNSGTEVKAAAAHEQSGTKTSELEVEEDCDFAYRLREIQYSKIRRIPKKPSRFATGTLFGTGKGHGSGEEQGEDVPAFEYMEEEDVSANSGEVLGLKVEDEEAA